MLKEPPTKWQWTSY